VSKVVIDFEGDLDEQLDTDDNIWYHW
jgi:hypothetical protein